MQVHTQQPETNARGSVLRDIGAGLTNAVANVPDAMANAALTGVSPVRGLYSLMVGTPVAALTTSSEYLTVAVTAAMAAIVGDALATFAAADRPAALVALTILVGALTIALGRLKAGKMMRFVPNAVMRGFLTGVAVNIIFGQIPNLTGAVSTQSTRLMRTLDILTHPRGMQVEALALAAMTAVVVLSVERTPLRRFAMAVALVAISVLAHVLNVDAARVSDVGAIPPGLPSLVLPSLSSLGSMLVPAVAVSLIGLIQTAGVSKNTPNTDGSYPDMSRDFTGQGFANVAAAVIGGVPVGGSVSSTALNVQAGARSRLANFVVGPVILTLVLLLSAQVEAIPMSVLASLLVIVGVRAIGVDAIAGVWRSSQQSAAILATTFVGTLVMPIQYAVLLGIALAVVMRLYAQGVEVRSIGIELAEDGRLIEVPAPGQLTPDTVSVIEWLGSLTFAGAQAFEAALPDPGGATGAILVFRVRGQEGPGSTFIEVLRRYHEIARRNGVTVVLAGVGPDLRAQLERTGMLRTLGRENIFPATQIITDATVQAIVESRHRIATADRRRADGAG